MFYEIRGDDDCDRHYCAIRHQSRHRSMRARHAPGPDADVAAAAWSALVSAAVAAFAASVFAVAAAAVVVAESLIAPCERVVGI